jgi:hypothetical protein
MMLSFLLGFLQRLDMCRITDASLVMSYITVRVIQNTEENYIEVTQ